MDVSKKSQENQATITKKPVKETKTVEVPLIREEVNIERRPPKGGSEREAQSAPVQSEEEIKIPVKREVEVTKIYSINPIIMVFVSILYKYSK